jgi:3-hydroxyisobutyrate dehydrogenase-like beta-hydroxyacid dehydrogenase
MRIAFIGIGLMGHGMALNLLKEGQQVTVLAHRSRKLIDDLLARGAKEASDHRSLAGGADAVLLCVTNSKAVEEVIGALEPHLMPRQVVIDLGTSSVSSNVAIAKRLAGKGVAFAEAPLTGGPEQAAAAELGALVGADPETFERITPILQCFCATISHMGPVGAGSTAKVISNYLVLGMVALIGDTYVVARKAGVDWDKLYAAMLRGSNNSGALRKMVGPAIEGNFDGYPFSFANARKDFSYYLEVARDLGVVSDIAKAAMDVYEKANASGYGDARISRLLDPQLKFR